LSVVADQFDAVGLQFPAQRGEILDDAVVHDGQAGR